MAKSIRIVLFAVVLAMLALPATAPAKKGHGKLNRNAARLCKQLRSEMGAGKFRVAYGAKRDRPAFKRCVKRTSRTLKQTRGQGKSREAIRQAQADCREEFDSDFQEIDFESDDEPQTGDGGAPQGDFADCIDDYAGDDFAPEAEEPDDDPGVDQPADDSAPDGESDADY